MPWNRACRIVIAGARRGVLAGALVAACSSDDGGTGANGPVLAKANPSGDAQAGRPGDDLAADLRVIITDGGAPVAGTTVNWAVTAGGGTVTPTSGPTDAAGIASTTATLGNTPGQMTIRATAAGTTGGPVDFTALIAGATVTVQAAANNTFQPSLAAVTAGGTVTFEWPAGALQHNVMPYIQTTQDGPVTHDVVFPAAGTFNFFCSVHGTANSGMRGSIIVVP